MTCFVAGIRRRCRRHGCEGLERVRARWTASAGKSSSRRCARWVCSLSATRWSRTNWWR